MNPIWQWIETKALRLVSDVAEVLPEQFYLAGGCFGKVARDLDIFPCSDEFSMQKNDSMKLVCETKNARTYKYKGVVIQACNYRHDSLKKLLESFDFAHVQIGAGVSVKDKRATVFSTRCTKNYISAKAIGDSWYTGSDYPLSSLVRLGKYHSRGEVSKGKMIQSSIGILADIVERGFRGYDDFKDQLDAVDIGLLSEEMDEVSRSQLGRLFNLLEK